MYAHTSNPFNGIRKLICIDLSLLDYRTYDKSTENKTIQIWTWIISRTNFDQAYTKFVLTHAQVYVCKSICASLSSSILERVWLALETHFGRCWRHTGSRNSVVQDIGKEWDEINAYDMSIFPITGHRVADNDDNDYIHFF